jgi:hypothetical protein
MRKWGGKEGKSRRTGIKGKQKYTKREGKKGEGKRMGFSPET